MLLNSLRKKLLSSCSSAFIESTCIEKTFKKTFIKNTCIQNTFISRMLSSSSSSSSSGFTTIVIEGNIGSGKTTLLQHFNRRLETRVYSEPVHKWRNVRGVNLFQMMADDTKRWCFPFQSYVQLTMTQLHQMIPDEPQVSVKMMERSLFSARYCFVENLYRSGIMSKEEYVLLDEWFQHIVATQKITVDLIIYLRTKPETVYERIKLRGRQEEKNITLEYLQKLHHLHEEWLMKKSSFSLPAPVLTIDADLQLEQIKHLYEQHSNAILNGINCA